MDKAGINMRTMKGFEELRRHSADKHQWKETIEHIYVLNCLFPLMAQPINQSINDEAQPKLTIIVITA